MGYVPQRKPRRKTTPRKENPKAKKARESKLLAELCQKHGYMFQDAPKGKRMTMTMVREPKTRVEASYKIILIVPVSSALGEQFAERYGHGKTPKTEPSKAPKTEHRQTGADSCSCGDLWPCAKARSKA